MRSGSAKRIALALCPVLVLGFAACETTQDKAARLAVRSDRQSDRKPIQVHRVDHQVSVLIRRLLERQVREEDAVGGDLDRAGARAAGAMRPSPAGSRYVVLWNR